MNQRIKFTNYSNNQKMKDTAIYYIIMRQNKKTDPSNSQNRDIINYNNNLKLKNLINQ